MPVLVSPPTGGLHSPGRGNIARKGSRISARWSAWCAGLPGDPALSPGLCDDRFCLNIVAVFVDGMLGAERGPLGNLSVFGQDPAQGAAACVAPDSCRLLGPPSLKLSPLAWPSVPSDIWELPRLAT